MKRIRVQIQEYEPSRVYVEETINETLLDLPEEALEEIKKVVKKFDNQGFMKKLRMRISKDIDEYPGTFPRYETLLYMDLERLSG